MTSPNKPVLFPLDSASQYLEGNNYPTSNLVLPSMYVMYGCIKQLSADVPTPQPWDGKLRQPTDLRPSDQRWLQAGRFCTTIWSVNGRQRCQKRYSTGCSTLLRLRRNSIWGTFVSKEHIEWKLEVESGRRLRGLYSSVASIKQRTTEARTGLSEYQISDIRCMPGPMKVRQLL